MSWFTTFLKARSPFSDASEPHIQDLHLSSIPRKADKSLFSMSYPQGEHSIPAHNLAFFRDRYAEMLWELIDELPLSEQDADRLFMPIFTRLYSWMHLLPASENHHHAGMGGLIVHSLESATIAAKLAKTFDFPKCSSSRGQYHAKPKWQVAAAVTLLVHDIGKTFDIQVIDDDGLIWNPTQEDLLNWLSTNHVERYYARWSPQREHKKHELLSIGLAHRFIVPNEVFSYLGKETEGLILRAIDTAIVFGEGPLAPILKKAEEESIVKDLEVQKHLGMGMTIVSIPSARPALSAISELMKCGTWSCNQTDSAIFFTTCGTFLRLTAKNAQTVREVAEHFGAHNVPSSVFGLVRILQEAGLLIKNEDATSQEQEFFWNVFLKNNNEPISNCIRFADSSQIFSGGNFPEPIAVELKRKESKPTSVTSVDDFNWEMLLPPKEKKECLKTSKDTFPSLHLQNVSPCETMTSHELQCSLNTPMSSLEVKEFFEKLIATLILQMQNGGDLAPDLQRMNEQTLRCSSSAVFQVLKQHLINEISFKTLLRQRRNHPRIVLVDDDSAFELHA